MDLRIVDGSFTPIEIIDTYESLIWTDRYLGYGDFEVYTMVESKILDSMIVGNIITNNESEHSMIIEDREIITDVENGNRLIITGRSLEALLYWRVVWGQKNATGNLQDIIESLLDENMINPIDPDRAVSNFIFEASVDPEITALTADVQFMGEYLYDAIYDMCVTNNIGFKILLVDKDFVFSLYKGADRSYDQVVNPYIVFSPEFDNILNSNFFETDRASRNVTLVAGEGEGTDIELVSVGSGSGLYRREVYTDASNISRTVDSGLLTIEDYRILLNQRGEERLSEKKAIASFEGEVETNISFKYDEDYFMGDIIQIRNEYGMEANSRITEVIRSVSVSGRYTIPTFTKVE